MLCHSDRAILDGFRVWEEATDRSQSSVIEELSTVVTGLKKGNYKFKKGN